MKNFDQQWVAILTRGNREIFDDVRAKSKCDSLAILKLRRELINDGVGQVITSEDLQLCNCRDESYLQDTLQNLFLEPVSKNHLELLYKQIVKKGYSIEQGLDKLYQRHREDQTLRLLSVILII